jgi:hypothetical protein
MRSLSFLDHAKEWYGNLDVLYRRNMSYRVLEALNCIKPRSHPIPVSMIVFLVYQYSVALLIEWTTVEVRYLIIVQVNSLKPTSR